jgi:RHS repeat-associated protein
MDDLTRSLGQSAALCLFALACGGEPATHPAPSPVPTAPPLDATVASNFADAFKFLYDGPNAVQKGIAPGAIDERRMTIVRGRVLDRSASPVAGATITAPDHPEYGESITREDGTFDFVLNGGGAVRLRIKSDGYLRLERTLRPSWRSFEPVGDLFLTALDAQVTEVALGKSSKAVFVRATTATDRSGSRAAALHFPSGTAAEMVLPTGERRSLGTAHVRATEYTVGDTGPKAMPATLPTQSGYTYAVELSVDEAEDAEATGVEFSQPVPVYVDNFLNFPVGEPVPAGYFDKAQGQWVAAPSGRVIEILDVHDGLASIDGDGDGKADDQAALDALGIDEEEQTSLAANYDKGSVLWRVPVAHFSSWDFNWCFFGGLLDALADLARDVNPLDDSCETSGSVIECENQILGESVAITGTPERLYYRSDRVPGRRDAFSFDLKLTGKEAPPKAKRVRLELEILGSDITYSATAAPNLEYHYEWDGKDGYGRPWQGPASVRYRVGYVYDGWYGHTPVFGQYGQVDPNHWAPAPDSGIAPSAGVTPEDDLARRETTMWLAWQDTTLGTFDAAALGFGGFTLGDHHAYDPESRTLYLGNGERRNAGSARDVVRALIGEVDDASASSQSDGTRADPRQTVLAKPHGVAVAPDGTIYVGVEDANQVLKLGVDGRVEVVAGTGETGYAGDGGPAAEAELNKPLGLALADDGSLFIAERGNAVVRRVGPDGSIETFAGGGTPKSGFGDGGNAKDASFGEPHALAFGHDGSLFIADGTRGQVRRVRADGVIETVIGSPDGTQGDDGDGGPGVKAHLTAPLGLAVGSDGSLYVADYETARVRRLAPDGTISTIAGTGVGGDSGDGGPATMAELYQPHTVDVAPNGSVYIADEGNHRVRVVTPDGVIHPLTGGGTQMAKEFVPAQDAHFDQPRLIAVEPSGRVLIGDYSAGIMYRLVPFLPGPDPDGYTIASDDGMSYFAFDRTGRHLKTVDALTSQTVASFEYDDAGRLLAERDVYGRALTIARDSKTGRATSLQSPDGLTTALSYSSAGWLASVKNPADDVRKFTLDESGLLKEEVDPAGRHHTFDFDSAGLLVRDTEASGSFQELSRNSTTGTIKRTTASGLSYSYARTALSDGSERRTVTGPDGNSTVTTRTPGHEVTQRIDGTSVETEFAPDPRFGLGAKYPSQITVTTPSGLASRLVTTRDLELTDPADPSTLTSYGTSVSLNDTLLARETFDVGTLTRTTVAFGVTTTTKLNTAGQIIEIDPAGGREPVHFKYDSAGRLVALSQGTRSTSLAYGQGGFLTSATDAAANASVSTRDPVGRLLQLDQSGTSTTFSYTHGDLTALATPNGDKHVFEYDDGGRQYLYRSPAVPHADGSDLHYEYDADDGVHALILPSGRRFERTIDAKGHLVAWTTPESAVEAKYDDKTGKLTELHSDSNELAYVWDGPLLKSVEASGVTPGVVGYAYDSSFRTTSETVKGEAIGFSYDEYSRLAQAGDETLSYSDDGRSLAGTKLETLAESFSYSSDYGELSNHIVANDDTTLYRATFERDALGRITTKTEDVQGTELRETYEYDALGRLSSATRDGLRTEYSYDANGNPKGKDFGLDHQDRLLAAPGVTFTYDSDGALATRTSSEATFTFSYDTLGELRTVDTPDHHLEYAIDPAGHRVAKTIDGELTQGFLYDRAGRVVAELDGSSAVTSRFVYASRSFVPDYMIHGGHTYRLVTDYRGSVRLVIDIANGAVAEALDYDAWGKVLSDTKLGFQPFGFAGGLFDADTGLVHFGARDYDPSVGRWTAKDPILFRGGQVNLYAYAGNDPVNHVDPSGLCVADGMGIGAAALVGLGVLAIVALPELAVAAEVAELAEGAEVAAEAAEAAEAVEVASGEARVGDTVYRAWGGGSRPWGASWTRVDPSTIANFRDAAGLPSANTGQFVSVGRLVSTEGVQARAALSLEGNVGGLDELLIPNAESQIELQFVGGANPGF